MRSFVALSVVLLATSAHASPVITIPLKRLQGVYLQGAPDADHAHVAFLKSRHAGGPTSVWATSLGYVRYTTTVGIGSPPTYYNLVVDTGSSNTFVGAGVPYVRTSTSIPTGEDVKVTYVLGEFMGSEYLDQVTLALNLIIKNQSIGGAFSARHCNDVDGILGLGPIDLTYGTLSPDTNAVIPTVMNNLVSQKLIEDQVLGVYFAPVTNYGDSDGVLTYGGIDSNLHEGDVMYVPVTETHPASTFWGFNITSATYGTHTIIPTSTAGIVDTGTTLVLLADDFFNVYLNAIPGATMDRGYIEIPSSSIPHMEPLHFTIAGRVFTMDVAAQLMPEDVDGKHYGVVNKLGVNGGRGFDFIFGQKFVERFYVVLDADTHRIGFAETSNTFTNYQG